MKQFSNDGRPRRREYSKLFKAQLVAQCGPAGASVGGVALAYGLHSNLVHRCIREARQDLAFMLSVGQGQPAAFVASLLPVRRLTARRPASRRTAMRLPQSAKLNGHDPHAYLKDVMNKLPTWLNTRIDELLPQHWTPEGIEA